tara:strand:- start:2002 stop:3186 length:1185 start_codon:yes stop_codon:yes gene_type:complete
MTLLLEPFSYGYMTNAMWVSALIGGVCAFLSAYLMLKGWSLIGDALSHSVVPGVAGAYMLGLPFALGAFLSGGLAAAAMLFLSDRSGLKVDVVIGMIFTSFFGIGLFMISINPMSVSVQTITMGNILAITPQDTLQLVIIGVVTLVVLLAKWRDLMVTFFDENHARSIGLRPTLLKAVFFMLLSACVVAAMQTVGAFLVIAMVVTPGATAYLLCDRFSRLILTAVCIGALTGFFGAYASYFLDGATGGIITTLQTLIFLAAFTFAPKHGILAARARARAALRRPLPQQPPLSQQRPADQHLAPSQPRRDTQPTSQPTSQPASRATSRAGASPDGPDGPVHRAGAAEHDSTPLAPAHADRPAAPSAPADPPAPSSAPARTSGKGAPASPKPRRQP